MLFSQKEDDNNSGSGHPPKKRPTRLAIGECMREYLYKLRLYRCFLLRLSCVHLLSCFWSVQELKEVLMWSRSSTRRM